MKVSFAEWAAEAFAELPQATKLRAARLIELLAEYPRMYPVRRRGLMRGYRYFVAGRHLIYYSVTSQEVRILAVVPGAMNQA